MIKRILIVLALLAALIGQAGAVTAAGSPLIMTYKGDLWTWDGTQIEARTNWGYNFAPVISPTGTYIAYKSTAQVAVDAIKTYGFPGAVGELPATIWLMRAESDEAVRIGNQPDDASLWNPNVADKYIIRSDPTWSPDGKMIAWTEGVIENAQSPHYRLVTYNIAAKASTILIDNLPTPGNYEGFVTMPVVWGEPGLAVLQSYVEMPNFGGSVLVYNTNGQLVSTSPKIPNLANIVWISDGAQMMVGLIAPHEGVANSVTWQLYNPQGGDPQPLNGIPELFSLTAPNGATISPQISGAATSWVASPSGEFIEISGISSPFGFLSSLAISPDGKQIAYATESSIVAQTDSGTFQTVISTEQISGVVWGPVGWRIQRANG